MSPQIIMASGGRFIIAGAAGFLSAAPGVTPMSALALHDFQVGHSLAVPVVQRKAGSSTDTDPGRADIPVLFTPTGGDPTTVQARVVNKDAPTTVIKDWAYLANVNTSGGVYVGTLEGVDAGDDYVIQIRDGAQPTNSATTSNGTQRWGIGVCILGEGQSNMVGTLAAGSYQDNVPGITPTIRELEYFIDPRAAGAIWGTSGAVAMTNLGGTGTDATGGQSGPGDGGVLSLVRIVATALHQKYNRKIPVCFIPSDVGATALDAWLVGGGMYEAFFNGSGTAPGAIGFKSPRNYWAGDFEAVVLHQGEADDGMSRAARLAKLKQYCQLRFDYVARFGRTPQQLAILPAILGSYGAGASFTGVDSIRAAVFDLERDAPGLGWIKVRAGWCCIDLVSTDPTNPLHIQGEQRIQSQRRLVQSILHEVAPGLAVSSGVGPRITSITRNGTGLTATVTVQHDGGTALVGVGGGTTITGYTAHTDINFDDTKGHTVTVSAAIASANTLTLSFSELPAYVRYLHGMTPDISNAVLDNVTYPSTATGTDVRTGLPLLPTPDAIMVN